MQSISYPADTKHACVLGDDEAVYVVCTRPKAGAEVFRIPWDSLDVVSAVSRTVVQAPTHTELRHVAAVMKTEPEPTLVWVGNTIRADGSTETLITQVPVTLLNQTAAAFQLR